MKSRLKGVTEEMNDVMRNEKTLEWHVRVLQWLMRLVLGVGCWMSMKKDT